MDSGSTGGVGSRDQTDLTELINQFNNPVAPLGTGAVTPGQTAVPGIQEVPKTGTGMLTSDQYETVGTEQREQRREALFGAFQEKGSDGKPDGNLDVNAFAAHLSEKTGETVSPAQVRAFFGAGADGKISKSQFVEGPRGLDGGSEVKGQQGDEAKKAHGQHGGGGKVSDDTTCAICGNSPCTCADVVPEAQLQSQTNANQQTDADYMAEMARQILKSQAIRV